MKQIFMSEKDMPKNCAGCQFFRGIGTEKPRKMYNCCDCIPYPIKEMEGTEIFKGRPNECELRSLEQHDKEVQANAIRAFAKRLKLKKQDITYRKGADLVYGMGVSLKDIDELLKEYLNE